MTSLTVAVIGAGQFILGLIGVIVCSVLWPQYIGLMVLESGFGAAVFVCAFLYKLHRVLEDK